MKQVIAAAIVFLATTLLAKGQYNKCASSASIKSFYYTVEPHTNFGFGFEAGEQGVDTRIGYFAGFQFQKMSDGFFKKDSLASFKLRANFYLKGTYRINAEPSGKGSLFLVAYPSLSVQTGFDFKTGLRGVLPLNESKAVGIEPSFSLKFKTASLDVMFFF